MQKTNKLVDLKLDSRFSRMDPASRRPAPDQNSRTAQWSFYALFSFLFCSFLHMHCLEAQGAVMHLRALLDTRSQFNVISASAAKKLGLPIAKSDVTIRGVGAGRPYHTDGKLELAVALPRGKYSLSCDILEHVVAELQNDQFDGYRLDDPDFHTTKSVDILIGMSNYNDFVLPYRVPIDGMWLQHTVLGWALTGKLINQYPSPVPGVCHAGPIFTSAPGAHDEQPPPAACLIPDQQTAQMHRNSDANAPTHPTEVCCRLEFRSALIHRSAGEYVGAYFTNLGLFALRGGQWLLPTWFYSTPPLFHDITFSLERFGNSAMAPGAIPKVGVLPYNARCRPMAAYLCWNCIQDTYWL